jgi:hypothetical protein
MLRLITWLVAGVVAAVDGIFTATILSVEGPRGLLIFAGDHMLPKLTAGWLVLNTVTLLWVAALVAPVATVYLLWSIRKIMVNNPE